MWGEVRYHWKKYDDEEMCVHWQKGSIVESRVQGIASIGSLPADEVGKMDTLNICVMHCVMMKSAVSYRKLAGRMRSCGMSWHDAQSWYKWKRNRGTAGYGASCGTWRWKLYVCLCCLLCQAMSLNVECFSVRMSWSSMSTNAFSCRSSRTTDRIVRQTSNGSLTMTLFLLRIIHWPLTARLILSQVTLSHYIYKYGLLAGVKVLFIHTDSDTVVVTWGPIYKKS